MNRYLKLVHWEIMRFWKLLAALAIVTIVLQCVGIIYETQRYTSQVEDQVQMNNSTITAFVQQNGKLSFSEALERAGLSFFASIALCIGGLALYVFFIWYKEWFGKNMFIYRLLMIPTARRNIYFAKLTAILLFVLSLVALQLVLLPLENGLYLLVGGDVLFKSSSIVDLIAGNRILMFLIPPTFADFVIYYGFGAIVVLIAFTAVLLERSYKLRGVLAAILYLPAVAVFMMIPFLIPGNVTETYLYPAESFGIEIALGVIVTAFTVWLGLHLITKKVTV
ncbi:hypothetical protein [Paenibacillus sacheonensis]|uniref:Uncharacterized protein n=1 Tax=Paenibacillus sacheonensis TaxID=742054 RepID=A0A7X4YTD8_9BACL|nr:hypothetical protein [Paenibacillus sacheonensis]MBM7565721.1 hypothetical protein [Paenibacillus sacheonensis]NBC72221.1 hypothetical protein [Paenibacillus sacheonensis]